MEKKCQRCKKTVSGDDFICPYCGAILGDDMVIPVTDSEKKRGIKRPIRQSLRWVCGAVLLALAVLAAGFLWKGFQNVLLPSAAPSAPETTQTTAPLVTYNIQIKLDDRNTLKGATIQVYSGDQVVYVCQSGQYGKATIILPASDDYYIRLSDLPTQLQMIYGEISFPFSQGQRDMVVVLEEEPVPYTVTVVNEAGEPLPGALLSFNSYDDGQSVLSDENGRCVFYSMYTEEGNYASIEYTPTGYYSLSKQIKFIGGSVNAEVVLHKYEDMELLDSQCIYTVQVVDEYDAPVSDLDVYVCFGGSVGHGGPEYAIKTNGLTNLDGFFTFVGDRATQYSIMIPKHPDYSDKEFLFEEGSTHQKIRLEMHKTEFTYTVRFVNQYDEPIPGVEIAVSNRADFEQLMRYTSDENGIISFRSKEPEPSFVIFWLTSVPDGYDLDTQMRNMYYFSPYSRTISVELTHQTTITVVDDEGVPIPGAVINVDYHSIVYSLSGETNENGQCFFFLPTNEYFKVEIVSLPDGYEYLVFAPSWIEGFEREVIIKPLRYSSPTE